MNSVSTETRKYELKARAKRQRETRTRITKVAAELHEEVGVARTTVAEIARRAGVSRLTVYNHFKDDSELLPACSAYYMERHPRPDLSAAFAHEDPRERVRAALGPHYRWYRENERLMANVAHDRAFVPALDDFVSRTTDARLAELADGLAAGFGLRGRRAGRVRAHIRLALDFTTWSRLAHEGLADDEAADLMADAVAGVSAAGAAR